MAGGHIFPDDHLGQKTRFLRYQPPELRVVPDYDNSGDGISQKQPGGSGRIRNQLLLAVKKYVVAHLSIDSIDPLIKQGRTQLKRSHAGLPEMPGSCYLFFAGTLFIFYVKFPLGVKR